MIAVTVFFIPKTVTVPVASYDSFLPCPFLQYTYTYVYSALSLTRVHLSSAIQLTQICIMYSIIAVYALPFRVASMPAVRYDLNGGLPMCLWYDWQYIRIIWLLLCLWNLCKPDLVPVSIYVESILSESESESKSESESESECESDVDFLAWDMQRLECVYIYGDAYVKTLGSIKTHKIYAVPCAHFPRLVGFQ